MFCHNSAKPDRDLLMMNRESPESPNVKLVDLSAGSALPVALQQSAIVGLDTEFIREKTFFSQLCLIQVAAGDTVWCADPLAGDVDDNREFWNTLMSTPCVLHSGRQDIEVLYQASGRMPPSIFDTQIAAALLGYQPQIGYGSLVGELFGIELEKAYTRADWSQRPLPDEYVEYAALDVHYLLPARDELAERLDRLGRLAWAEEDSEALLDKSLYEIDTATAVNRLKGAGNLRGSSRVAAEALAAWREEEALRRNRPRQWILRDTALLEIVTSGASSKTDLARISGIGKSTVERSGRQILERLESVAGKTSNYAPPARPDENQKRLLKEMRNVVARCAEDSGIAAEIIAPRRELAAAITGDTSSRVFCGWRRELVGNELLQLIDHA